MRVEIASSQTLIKPRKMEISRLVQQLMARVVKLNPERCWDEISVAILDDDGITPVNLQYFGMTRPTDVISLAYEPVHAEEGWVGEVIVNAERALQEGPNRPGGWRKELALYIAHGCDHLSGADDATPEQRRKMRRRELAWLNRIDYSNIAD